MSGVVVVFVAWSEGMFCFFPQKVFGQEGRYAHALYSAAAKSSALEAVEADLASIAGLIQSNAALNTFLVNPR